MIWVGAGEWLVRCAVVCVETGGRRWGVAVKSRTVVRGRAPGHALTACGPPPKRPRRPRPPPLARARKTHHRDREQDGVALEEDALDLVRLAVARDADGRLHRERLLHLLLQLHPPDRRALDGEVQRHLGHAGVERHELVAQEPELVKVGDGQVARARGVGAAVVGGDRHEELLHLRRHLARAVGVEVVDDRERRVGLPVRDPRRRGRVGGGLGGFGRRHGRGVRREQVDARLVAARCHVAHERCALCV